MNIDPSLPFGIQFDVFQETITSIEALERLLNEFLEGIEVRKWNLRLYVAKEVAEQLLSLKII